VPPGALDAYLVALSNDTTPPPTMYIVSNSSGRLLAERRMPQRAINMHKTEQSEDHQIRCFMRHVNILDCVWTLYGTWGECGNPHEDRTGTWTAIPPRAAAAPGAPRRAYALGTARLACCTSCACS
jgi:hypothetical protein